MRSVPYRQQLAITLMPHFIIYIVVGCHTHASPIKVKMIYYSLLLHDTVSLSIHPKYKTEF